MISILFVTGNWTVPNAVLHLTFNMILNVCVFLVCVEKLFIDQFNDFLCSETSLSSDCTSIIQCGVHLNEKTFYTIQRGEQI